MGSGQDALVLCHQWLGPPRAGVLTSAVGYGGWASYKVASGVWVEEMETTIGCSHGPWLLRLKLRPPWISRGPQSGPAKACGSGVTDLVASPECFAVAAQETPKVAVANTNLIA